MIRGYCCTNLDDYTTTKWPTEFVAVPRIGERVESIDGKRSLKVHGITHKMTKSVLNFPEPIIEVELHK